MKKKNAPNILSIINQKYYETKEILVMDTGLSTTTGATKEREWLLATKKKKKKKKDDDTDNDDMRLIFLEAAYNNNNNNIDELLLTLLKEYGINDDDDDDDRGAPYPNTMIYTEPRADLFLRKNVPFLMDLDLLDSIQNNEDFQDRFEAQYAKEGEVWEAVDNYGHRIMGVPNEWAMLNRWMVRGVGIILLNYEQDKIMVTKIDCATLTQVFVHKRSQSKKNFPGMYDMFIGGHSNDKEHDLETIYRELNEEIGLDEPLHLCDAEYQCVVKTSTNNVFVGLYRAVAPPNFEPEFRDGEIAWGDWMSRDEIEAKLESQEWDWVPDGLQVRF
eukprot:jgi/Bigna1/147568/aug1.206_g22276